MKATDREKAVIFALAAGGVEDWREAYILSRETPTEPERERNIKYLRAIVTRWKQRPDIAAAYNNAAAILAARDERNRAEAVEEERRRREEGGQEEGRTEGGKERTQKGRPAGIDYTRPENQKSLLNTLINTAEDQRDKLDALKTIIQAQKDDRQAAKDNQIQRFYTPLKCLSCPLYKKANK